LFVGEVAFAKGLQDGLLSALCRFHGQK
jgi:hypothetical protein